MQVRFNGTLHIQYTGPQEASVSPTEQLKRIHEKVGQHANAALVWSGNPTQHDHHKQHVLTLSYDQGSPQLGNAVNALPEHTRAMVEPNRHAPEVKNLLGQPANLAKTLATTLFSFYPEKPPESRSIGGEYIMSEVRESIRTETLLA